MKECLANVDERPRRKKGPKVFPSLERPRPKALKRTCRGRHGKEKKTLISHMGGGMKTIERGKETIIFYAKITTSISSQR